MALVEGRAAGGVDEVLVVGGGIVGLAVALRLQAEGLGVTIIDDPANQGRYDDGSEFGAASFGNAGHIATEQVRPLTRPDLLRTLPGRSFLRGGPLDLGWRYPGSWLPWSLQALAASFRFQAGEDALTALLADARPAWERLANSLGQPELLAGDSHLILWHDAKAAQQGRAAWLSHAIGRTTVEDAPAALLAEAAQHLAAPPCAGLRFRGTGQVSDPILVMKSLKTRFLRQGGQWVLECVKHLAGATGTTGVTLQSGATRTAKRLVLAAGARSAGLARQLGVYLPVIAERGYHVSWTHGAGYALPPSVFEERAMIVSRFGDRLQASSFVEFTRIDAPPDVRKWKRLEHHVQALGLPRTSDFKRWIGARPTLPDYLPAIGISPACPCVYFACGHQHLGLTLAPKTAEILADLMLGRRPEVALTPFRPDRFPLGRFVTRARRAWVPAPAPRRGSASRNL